MTRAGWKWIMLCTVVVLAFVVAGCASGSGNDEPDPGPGSSFEEGDGTCDLLEEELEIGDCA